MFRWLALTVLAGTIAVSGYYRRRARAATGTIPRSSEPLPLIAGKIAVGVPLFGGILAYIVSPSSIAWASYDGPEWLRWFGVALGVCAIVAARWVLRALGSNVSETVLMKPDHTLVTHGPYRWIRHPLYTNGIMLFAALALMAANWFILVCALIALVSIRCVVVPMEERRLVGRFGEAYERYRQRTGAMTPRLRRGKPPGIAVGCIVSALASGLLLAAVAGVEPWKPAGVSSPQFESHAAFDPKTGDLYFVRSSPRFTGWRILVSRCTATGWWAPQPPPFAGDGVEADPFFTPEGRSLYFISSRTVEGVQRRSLDIWRVERDDAGAWGAPMRLPEPVNSPGAEWFPRPGPDGWLYFGSDRPGGLGATDLWRARRDADGKWTVENLGAEVNTPGDDYEPLPAPDGSRMILMAEGGLYETRRTATGWAPRKKLGPDINVNGTEIAPLFSPSGKSLLFARDTKGPDSGEFFVWYEHGREAWPPECPAGR